MPRDHGLALNRGLPGLRRPLLDASTGPRLLVLACPGCGYTATWHATDHDQAADSSDDQTEAE